MFLLKGFSFRVVYFIIIFESSLFLSFVTGQDPKGTPLDELIHIQNSHCSSKGVNSTDVQQIRRNWSKCIDKFILRPDGTSEEWEELRQYYSLFCGDTKGFKNCWNDVISLLNKCDSGRGNVSSEIYFATYDLTCKDQGLGTVAKIMEASAFDELCELDYATKACKESMSQWYSSDVCGRFGSLKYCEQSAILNCMNTVHKKMLVKNLEQIQDSLQCNTNNGSTKSGGNWFIGLLLPLVAIVMLIINNVLYGNIIFIDSYS